MLPHKFFLSLWTLQTTLAPASAASEMAPSSVINVNDDPTTPLDTTAWALIYTYPLAIFANFVGAVFEHVGVNEIYHQRELASPLNPGVIKPNVDTLYSRVVLDLSSHDVELTVPEIAAGRYWNYPAYDAFGNVIAEIGAVNGNEAGKYLIRRADDVLVAPGYQNANCSGSSAVDGSQGKDYKGIVNMPTSYGTMLLRLLVLHNTTSDLNILHAYQNASSLTPIKRRNPTSSGSSSSSSSSLQSARTPPLNSTALNGTFLGIQTPQQQLEFAARIVPHNQPELYAQRYRVASILARAGVYSGRFAAVPGVNLTHAAALANASLSGDVEAHARREGNGWQLQKPSYQGNYGAHYAAAAYVALTGYQQLTARQVLYPGFDALGFTSVFTLPRNDSAVLFSFSGKPRVAPLGFWSLTVYGADQYLIPNPLNRFEAGDRTYSLQYERGGLVYGPQADASHDGPFQVLAQPVGLPPPKNWTGNWLPVEQTFSIILRWYVPEAAMTNGSYVYPKVQNISAIV